MDSDLLFLERIAEEFSVFFDSTAFFLIKWAVGIYVFVLFLDIILLLVQRGVSGDLRETQTGMNIPVELTDKKSQLRKKWEKIKGKLESGKQSYYKVAVIEADALIDDLIARMGYPGGNMTERLEKIHAGQIENIESLRKSHLIRNRIINESGFRLDLEAAREALAPYEEFLDYFQVFD